jgi:HAD superfamily hydrolase (TIGR01509 family)
MNRQSIEAVVFDVDDTLIDRHAALARAVSAWGSGVAADELAVLPDLRRIALRLGGATLERKLRQAVLAAIPPAPPEQLDRLAALRSRGVRLAVATNGNERFQRAKLERAGLTPFFSLVVASSRVRARKPTPALLAAVLGQLAVPPSRVLVVGDDPALDMAPARALGAQALWISHGRPYPAGIASPTAVAADLDEALAWLA